MTGEGLKRKDITSAIFGSFIEKNSDGDVDLKNIIVAKCIWENLEAQKFQQQWRNLIKD